MPEEDSNSSSTGLKAFASILMLAALIGGVSALITPLVQRIDNMQLDLNCIRTKMSTDDDRERSNSARLATNDLGIKHLLAEIETTKQILNHTIDIHRERAEQEHKYIIDECILRIEALEKIFNSHVDNIVVHEAIKTDS